MTKAKTLQIGDADYDPSLDNNFLDQVQPPEATQLPTHTTPLPKRDGGGYAETGYTAAELIEAYGAAPDGTPRTEPVPDTPACPPVSPDGYPFDTTTIPQGCNEPLSAECAAFYNERYKPTNADSPPEFAKK